MWDKQAVKQVAEQFEMSQELVRDILDRAEEADIDSDEEQVVLAYNQLTIPEDVRFMRI